MKETKIPVTVKSLLGMNLNFCPNPPFSSNTKQIQLDRLIKSVKTRIMFANGPPIEASELYAPNEDFKPATPNFELGTRLNNFVNKIR